jgi:hypothetical protein
MNLIMWYGFGIGYEFILLTLSMPYLIIGVKLVYIPAIWKIGVPLKYSYSFDFHHIISWLL